MQVEIFDKNGKSTEKTSLNDSIWKVPYNKDLVAQVLYVFFSNTRKGTAHAKTRGDVSGGGKKPWKQKGTGRARQGSIRAPQWVKGGVVFVPNQRNWGRSVNEKMRKKAVMIMLTKRLTEKAIKIVSIADGLKNSDYRKIVPELSANAKKVLVVTASDNMKLALRNTTNIKVIKPLYVNTLHLVNANYIVIDSEALKILETRLGNEK